MTKEAMKMKRSEKYGTKQESTTETGRMKVNSVPDASKKIEETEDVKSKVRLTLKSPACQGPVWSDSSESDVKARPKD